jgi:hypothetical protein
MSEDELQLSTGKRVRTRCWSPDLSVLHRVTGLGLFSPVGRFLGNLGQFLKLSFCSYIHTYIAAQYFGLFFSLTKVCIKVDKICLLKYFVCSLRCHWVQKHPVTLVWLVLPITASTYLRNALKRVQFQKPRRKFTSPRSVLQTVGATFQCRLPQFRLSKCRQNH